MDNFIAQRSKQIVLKDDIISLSEEAKACQKIDKSTINSTIGVFLNDDKTLNGVNLVKESIKDTCTTNLAYPNLLGTPAYKEAILKWLFKEKYDQYTNKYSIPFTATIGGTGALAIAFKSFLEAGDTVLLPSFMWGNYKLIAQNAGIEFDKYNLIYNDHGFDLESVHNKIKEYKQKQKSILIVINDPCQNPTGYSLKDCEYTSLIEMLNEEGKDFPITVFFDIAYLDYDVEDGKAHRLFQHLLNHQLSFLPLFGFSCSKTFGIYGLRLGALFALTNDKDTEHYIMNAIGTFVRGNYSCPNGPAINAIAEMLSDKQKADKAMKNIYENTEILHNRGMHMKSNLMEYNIDFIPYENGFYFTVKIPHCHDVFAKLKEKHIFIVPLNDEYARIAICSLNNEEIDVLTKEINSLICR